VCDEIAKFSNGEKGGTQVALAASKQLLQTKVLQI
jgi:hypothetical protein